VHRLVVSTYPRSVGPILVCRAALACALLFLAGSASAERQFHIIRTGPCMNVVLGFDQPYFYKSDDNGVVAIFEPDLMGKLVNITAYPLNNQIALTEGGESHPQTIQPLPGCGLHDSLLPGVTPPNTPPVPVPLPPYFTIHVFDAKYFDERQDCRFPVFPDSSVSTGCGVPGVKVTVEEPEAKPYWKTFVTDSNGVVAFYDPQLMAGSEAVEICFSLNAEGYFFGFPQPDECPNGNRGFKLSVTPGGIAQIGTIRVNIAERMYRLTGRGVYRDSIMLGLPVPPVSNVLVGQGLVMGQDTTQSTVYDGKAFWAWGDTNFPRLNSKNTRASAAVSQLPATGGIDPALGVDLEYFVDTPNGDARGMAPVSGFPFEFESIPLAWLTGLFTAPDAQGHERLFSTYQLINREVYLQTLEAGVGRFNDETKSFERVFAWDDEPVKAFGQAFKAGYGGGEYVYSATGVNTVRARATAEALEDPLAYEAFSPLRISEAGPLELDRLGDGSLRYAWKHGTPSLSNLTTYGPVSPEEALFGHMRDPRPGAHAFGDHGEGSTSWNEHRKRFVQIIDEVQGTSELALGEKILTLGELWYAEADTPMGPWAYGRKITLYNNTFERNPRLHSFLDQEGGRFVFFDATLETAEPFPTPSQRDDYNAIMYRLDLENPRLVLPLPIYDRSATTVPGDFADNRGLRPGMPDAPAAFFAQDRATSASTTSALHGLAIPTVPVHWSGAACAHPRLLAGGTPATRPVFHALPPDAPADPGVREGLYEFVDPITGAYAYSVAESLAGYERSAAAPLAVVWRNPISIPLPVSEYLPALIADAGADACLHAVSNVPGATIPVTLDASASLDQAGTVQSYTWNRWDPNAEDERGEQLGTGPAPQIAFAQGIHPILLTVTDDAGRSSTDSVVVQVDPPLDSDGDLVIDSYDNCLNVPNATQIDSNQDGYGNACDADYDGNGVVGGTDFSTFVLAFGSYAGGPNYNPDCDHTGDGIVGVVDYGRFANSFGNPPGPSGLVCAGTVPCSAPSP